MKTVLLGDNFVVLSVNTLRFVTNLQENKDGCAFRNQIAAKLSE